MKTILIFETPTRKGWLCIHFVDFCDGTGRRHYSVTLNEDKSLSNSRIVAHFEKDARYYAQGLFDGIETVI